MTESWKRVPVIEVCEYVVDCINKTAPSVDEPTPYKMIRTPNVKGGRVELDDVRYVIEEVYQQWTRRGVPRPGDILLTREAPLGEVGLLRSKDNVFLGQRLMMYRADPCKLDNRFLLCAFQTSEVQAQIKAHGVGSTVEHIRVPQAEQLLVPVPPLPIQRRIAQILGRLDDKIEVNRRINRTLEQMAQALYKHWFVDFGPFQDGDFVDSELGPIPAGWRVKQLKDVYNLTMGLSPKSKYYNEQGEGLPFHQGVTDFNDRFPTHRRYCTVTKRVAESGDVLFSVRAPVGRINLADRQIVIGRGVAALNHKDGFDSFLLYQLKYRFRKENSMSSGTIFKAVTKKDLQHLHVIVPPVQLVGQFDKRASIYDEHIASNVRANQQLAATRDYLLPKLLSGEVPVDAAKELVL